VTTPAQQQPAPQQDNLDDPALAVAVASAIVGVGAAAVTVGAAVATIKASSALSTAAAGALTAVLAFVTERPPAVTGVIGAASEQASRQNLARRAQFVIAATGRVLGAARNARAKGQPAGGAVRAQLERERRFYGMHQQAMWNRATAAGKADMAAAEHGPLLGWNTVIDGRTSPECRAADGKNFRVTAMPLIGFPGAVHPHCRCFPGPPHPGGHLLPSRNPVFTRAA
jgi:hypothetical protein